MTRLLAIVCVLAVAACSQSAPAAASSEPASPAAPADTREADQAAAPVPEQLPEVVARVNGEAISRADLELAVGELEARAGQPVPADQRDRIVRGILDQLIGYRLLLQESASRNVNVPDTAVEERLAQIRAQFPTEEVFQQTLQARRMTLASLREDTRDGLEISALLQAELGSRTVVTPEQVTQFYDQNPDEFQQGERVRASHILVRVQANADAAELDAARGRAAGILAEVKAGKDFAGLAAQHSDDPGSKVAGGDLGYFARGQMVGPFDETAFALAPGQTSELVRTDFGFHIIRVTDKQPPRTIPLAEVRDRIEEYLLEETRDQQTRAFVDSLRARGKVEIFI